MLDQVLALFSITPDRDLDVMRNGQGLTWITTAVLERLAETYAELRPDRVLVQGDTTTTFAASLAAFYARIPVGHVEAGLRTGNVHSPWPEEMNRRLTTHIADLHFPPTEQSRRNLLHEGIDPSRITVTGNTVIDALFDALAILDADPRLTAEGSMRIPGAGRRPGGQRVIWLNDATTEAARAGREHRAAHGGHRGDPADQGVANGNQPDGVAARAGARNNHPARTARRISGGDGLGRDSPVPVSSTRRLLWLGGTVSRIAGCDAGGPAVSQERAVPL
jgi:hypothetical protein